jgi:putative endonuclease
MKGYIYILLSLKDKKTYTGSTDNIPKRIQEHFAGKVKSTKYRRPLRLIYQKEYKSLQETRYMEKYYKSCAGRKKLKIVLEKFL